MNPSHLPAIFPGVGPGQSSPGSRGETDMTEPNGLLEQARDGLITKAEAVRMFAAQIPEDSSRGLHSDTLTFVTAVMIGGADGDESACASYSHTEESGNSLDLDIQNAIDLAKDAWDNECSGAPALTVVHIDHVPRPVPALVTSETHFTGDTAVLTAETTIRHTETGPVIIGYARTEPLG